MIKITTGLLFTLALLLVPMFSAKADYFVPPPGGQAVGQLTINKTIQHRETGLFVDNLTISDVHFLPDQDVVFRIEVKNTGSSELTNIVVKDIIPNFLDFVSGPGNFNAADNSVSFTVDKLAASDSKSFDIKAKIKSAQSLPANQVTCVTNVAQASVNQLFVQDAALFCFEAQVLPGVQVLPKTGPNSSIMIFLGTLTLFSLSVWSFKKSLKGGESK